MEPKLCVLCKYTKFDLISPQVRDSPKHEVIRCKKCKHVQLYPIPTKQEEKRMYDLMLDDKSINNYQSLEHAYSKMVDDNNRRVDLAREIVKRKRILEIGCGHGFFLREMKKKKYDVTGIDVSIGKASIVKKISNIEILNTDLSYEVPKLEKFDGIFMFHVLEHTRNPIQFLEHTKNLLKNNGKIIIEVPNAADYQLALNKEYYDFYWQKAHLNYFTPKLLKHVMRKAGLNILKIIGTQRYSIENMFSWRLTKKPQIDEPTYNLPKEYEWVEKPYRYHLEKNLICDTMVAIGTNSNKT